MTSLRAAQSKADPADPPRAPDDRRIAALLLSLALAHLRRVWPRMSAAAPPARWLVATLVAMVGALAGAAAVAADVARAAVNVLLALPFLTLAVWRLAALAAPRRGSTASRPLSAIDWPAYTVLVPLHREADALPGLVDALQALDYPRDRLEILLLLEEADGATRLAAARLDLPPEFRIVVVPDAAPRTKPKALALALLIARGDLITVYDAEDTPDPAQLRDAALALLADPRLACVQARLAIDNAPATWLTRQFAMEYAVLFSGLLPVLVRWRAPVPLGGTSNHFRRAALLASAGWDPYNVTEDADLGVRLHRLGYRVGLLDSETREEAVAHFQPWLRQRTRWVKGWMQTWAVHMRSPAAIVRETGWRGLFFLQLVLAGPLLSALVHPLFYVMLAADFWSGELFRLPESASGRLLMGVTTFNLLVGYLAAIGLTAALAIRAGARPSLAQIAGIPVYWLLMSLAAYRAVLHLITQPHHWEKTPHAPRPSRQGDVKSGGLGHDDRDCRAGPARVARGIGRLGPPDRDVEGLAALGEPVEEFHELEMLLDRHPDDDRRR
ncbi:MAG: glycosyltransferase family 2 protein [Hyphomicrobiaceae bacterium]